MDQDKTRVLSRQPLKPEDQPSGLEGDTVPAEPEQSLETAETAGDVDVQTLDGQGQEEDDQTRLAPQRSVALLWEQAADQESAATVVAPPTSAPAHTPPDLAGLFGQRTGEHALRPGDTLKGRFYLEEVIAEGGMGVVFKARDRIEATGGVNDSCLAIKMLGSNFKPQPEAWKSLLSEAKKTKNLAHPNIIKVYDFDHDPDWDEYFMTMEYLQGQSLEQLLRNSKGQPVEPALAYRVIEGIGRALEYAHAQKLVHSDMKPSNVFLTRDNEVKVLDFGIARVVRKAEEVSDKTVFGVEKLHAYTVAYASLEIIKGWPPDPCDDVYALACIAYKLLSGRHPFGADGEKYGAEYAFDTGQVPQPIKGLTKRQWRALERGLAFVRKQRTATVTEFLNGILPRSSRFKMTAIGVTLALAGLVTVAVYHFYQKPVIETTERVSPPPAAPGPELATIEQEGLALLSQFEREPAKPREWLGLAAQAHDRLAVAPLSQVRSVQQRASRLVARFMDESRRALANKDNNLADDYLTLAETLNVDSALERPLREARDAMSKYSPPPAEVPSSKSAEQRLLEMTPHLNSLSMSLSQDVYRDNELIGLEFDLPTAGSLHIFHFHPGEKPTLIYPNGFTPENRVGQGSMHFPNTRKIKLQARPPYGKSWFIAVLDAQAANLYRQYSKGHPRVQFVELSAEELIAFLQERLQQGQTRIGHAEMLVCPTGGQCE